MDAIEIAGKTEMELALIVSRFIEPTSDHEFFNIFGICCDGSPETR